LLQQALLRHLKASYKERWEYVTTTAFGPGMRNTRRLFKYVFDDQDLQDTIVRGHKLRLRKLLLYGATSIGAGVVTLGMTVLLRR
jgi:hypothetical protein